MRQNRHAYHGERRREPLGRVFGRQSTRGHHTNVLWQFGEVLFFNDFRFFRARIFRRIWSSISASQQISKNNFQHARSALGSEHRRLVRTPRRLIPSNQPMGQLRTQWRCQENSATASSRSKRPWNFEVFVCTLFGDFRARTRQNVVAVTWVRLWKKLLRRDKILIFHDLTVRKSAICSEPRSRTHDLISEL